jgi:hypothetical protein
LHGEWENWGGGEWEIGRDRRMREGKRLNEKKFDFNKIL